MGLRLYGGLETVSKSQRQGEEFATEIKIKVERIID